MGKGVFLVHRKCIHVSAETNSLYPRPVSGWLSSMKGANNSRHPNRFRDLDAPRPKSFRHKTGRSHLSGWKARELGAKRGIVQPRYIVRWRTSSNASSGCM